MVSFSGELKEIVEREGREPTKLDEAAELHKEVLREGIAKHGKIVQALEIVVGEVAEHFGGEDPALPHTRSLIDDAARRLEEARQEAERYTGPLGVAEPDDELVDKVRALVEDRRP